MLSFLSLSSLLSSCFKTTFLTTTSFVIFSFWPVYSFIYSTHFFSILISLRHLFQDSLSFLMVLITVVVLFSSLCFSDTSISKSCSLPLVYSLLLISCSIVFCSSRAIVLYFFYEVALLPILFIIIKWGVYPDRLIRSLILVLYTAFFTFPLLWCLISLFYLSHSFSIQCSPSSLISDPLFLLVVSSSFIVKLPVYGLHLWLPIAHVEAPTAGRIILAGVLLKLGGVGLIRISLAFKLELVSFTLSYYLISLVYVTLLCGFQSDLKRIIAYSSVSHMTFLPILFLINNLLRRKCFILLIFFHGLSSPLLFAIVGVLYSFFQTRQLVFLKGLALLNPLFRLLAIFTFLFSVAAPPFPSFTAEAFSFMACSHFRGTLLLFLGIYAFLSIAYRILWLVPVVFNAQTKVTYPINNLLTPTFNYIFFMPFFTSLLLGFAFITVFLYL